jgi:hypothetical protein
MKGYMLELEGRRRDAADTYAQVLERFPADERPDIDKAVASAREKHRAMTASRRRWRHR